MDYGLISGTLASLTALKELGQSAVGVRDAAKLGSIVVQMNEQILNVQANLFRHQAELMTLQEQHHSVQLALRELRDRQSERDRYELAEPYTGTFVYRLKDATTSEPPHMLCQPCFDKGIKSILQKRGSLGGCTTCGNTFRMERTPPREPTSYVY